MGGGGGWMDGWGGMIAFFIVDPPRMGCLKI
jgi:hypothetical protein